MAAGAVQKGEVDLLGLCFVQVAKQPAGKFSARGHFLRVAPVFVWPPLAWALHGSVMWLTGWKARRDTARLAGVQARMQKMLADLKVTILSALTCRSCSKSEPMHPTQAAVSRALVTHQVAEQAYSPAMKARW